MWNGITNCYKQTGKTVKKCDLCLKELRSDAEKKERKNTYIDPISFDFKKSYYLQSNRTMDACHNCAKFLYDKVTEAITACEKEEKK